jgi:hypothetical protein
MIGLGYEPAPGAASRFPSGLEPQPPIDVRSDSDSCKWRNGEAKVALLVRWIRQ